MKQRDSRGKPAAPRLSREVQNALVAAAAEARRGSVAPYSRFKVGAAFLTRGGETISGANVESASYGLTCCAERVALFHALTSGKRDFVALAVVTRALGGTLPCGACRQLLAEYAPEAVVLVADSRDLNHVEAHAMGDLLPRAFLQPRRPPQSRNRKSHSSHRSGLRTG